MSNFFGNRISGRKNAKCRVPTLALIVLISSIFLMVCFLFGAGWIIEPFFLRSKKTWFAEAAIFAKQKSTAESRMSNFFGNRISGRKNAKCRVPTLALIVLISSIFLMVCFLFGAGWIIEPFFLRSKKTWFAEAAIFAKQKSTAESRMSNFFGNRISGRKNAKCRVPTLKQPFCGCFIRADFSGRYEINAEHCMRSVPGM